MTLTWQAIITLTGDQELYLLKYCMNVLDPNNLTKAHTEIMQTCSISDVVMTFDGVPVVESSSMHLLGPKPMFSQVVIFIDFYLSSPRLEVYASNKRTQTYTAHHRSYFSLGHGEAYLGWTFWEANFGHVGFPNQILWKLLQGMMATCESYLKFWEYRETAVELTEFDSWKRLWRKPHVFPTHYKTYKFWKNIVLSKSSIIKTSQWSLTHFLVIEFIDYYYYTASPHNLHYRQFLHHFPKRVNFSCPSKQSGKPYIWIWRSDMPTWNQTLTVWSSFSKVVA